MKDFDINNNNNNNPTTKEQEQESNRRHWIPWGLASLREHRTPLLLWAFGLNFIAISGITFGAFAIQTSPNLIKVAWASATTTTSDLALPIINFENDLGRNDCIDEILSKKEHPEITVRVWLGLRGYYGECEITTSGSSDVTSDEEDTTTISSMTHPHSDSFCSPQSSNVSVASAVTDLMMTDELLQLPSPPRQEDCNHTTTAAPPTRLLWNCELLTGTIDDDDYETHQKHQQKECSACKDIQRSCMGTLLSSAVFGVFPLVLTIRRVCSARREKLLRLRTLFFSGLAIIFGFAAFIRFHFRCVHNIPPAWYAVVWQQASSSSSSQQSSSSLCSSVMESAEAALSPCTQPFLVSVPMEMKLHMGGKIVILAAVLKVAYFTLHLITPPHNIHHDQDNGGDHKSNDDDDDEEELLMPGTATGEKQGLLASSSSLVNKSSSTCTTDIESTATTTTTTTTVPTYSSEGYYNRNNSTKEWTEARSASSSKRKPSYASVVQQQQQHKILPNYESANPFSALSSDDDDDDSSTDDSSEPSEGADHVAAGVTTTRLQSSSSSSSYQHPSAVTAAV